MTIQQTLAAVTRPTGGVQPTRMPPLSRQNPPQLSRTTPQVLRMLQVAVLVVGLIVGAFGIPLAASSDGLVRQATVEHQYERLSSVSSGVLTANEAALGTMATGTNDPAAFRQRLQQVGTAMVAAAEILDSESDVQQLGRANGALNEYSRLLEQAIATLKTDPKQVTQAAALVTTAERTMDERILAPISELQQRASSQNQLVPSQMATVFRVVAVLCALVILGAMVLTAIRTRRMVNIGLAVSLVAIAGAIALSALVPAAAASDASASSLRSVTQGQEQLLRARSHELNMVLEPSNDAHRTDWTTATSAATQSFGAGGLDVAADLRAYRTAHETLVTKVKAGTPDEVAKAVTDAGRPASVIGRKATESITSTRNRQEVLMSSGNVGVTMISFGLGALGLVTVVAGLVGLQQRLREYR